MNQKDQQPSSILLIVDGLRPGMLGPYGNTWFDTNCINQLASESLLFEQCISDSPDIQLGLRGILNGQHCCDHQDRLPNLIDCLTSTGTDSILVTSNAEKFANSHDLFDRIVDVELPECKRLREESASTAMAVFFAAALDEIQNIAEPSVLVLDCPGFTDSWDAPYSFRKQLADSEDPDPSLEVAAPNLQFNPATDDPDLLLDYQIAYGGQVVMFDQLLSILLAEIQLSGWARNAMLCLTATRAYPLGEHGVVGYYRPILNSECIHTPLLIRWPESGRIVGRTQQLVQPGSLYSFLRQWHQVDGKDSSTFPQINPKRWLPDERNSALVTKFQIEGADHFSFQTHAWKYFSGPTGQLFVRPDDVWDYNDVAELCPRVVEELNDQLELALASLTNGIQPEFRLAAELAFGFE